MSEVRVRFAPSPTGFLHIGGARTALFNWLFAENKGGTFILRVEDTDRQRSTDESEQVILRAMKWLGMNWDEGPGTDSGYGPYRQSDRLALYKEYAQRLLEEGLAYKCFCTAEDLELARKKAAAEKRDPVYSGVCRELSPQEIEKREKEGRSYVIRFRVPKGQDLSFADICKGDIKFESDLFGDFVLLKSDGFPSYNFAVVVDDMLMRISHVIRGDDHITNTPRQIMLYRAFGAQVPEFAHIPMILGPDGSRLSKRHGATSVEEYEKKGYLSAAVVNYLSLLGWSPKDDKEIMDIKETVRLFSLSEVSRSPAVFDNTKLDWMNAQYIRQLEGEDLYNAFAPFIDSVRFDISDRDRMISILDIVKKYVTTLTDVEAHLPLFFDKHLEKTVTDEIKEFFEQEEASVVVNEYIKRVSGIQHDDFNADSLKKALKSIQKEFGIKGRLLFMPLRMAMSYRTSGPGVYEIMLVIGKDASVGRMKEFMQNVSGKGKEAGI
ncbi:MAG: glutamate--tRNA ligase [Candidatus Muiribacteriaceae bacterium]